MPFDLAGLHAEAAAASCAVVGGLVSLGVPRVLAVLLPAVLGLYLLLRLLRSRHWPLVAAGAALLAGVTALAVLEWQGARLAGCLRLGGTTLRMVGFALAVLALIDVATWTRAASAPRRPPERASAPVRAGPSVDFSERHDWLRLMRLCGEDRARAEAEVRLAFGQGARSRADAVRLAHDRLAAADAPRAWRWLRR